jgi:hypothetical protein
MRNARMTVLSLKLANPDKSVLSDLPTRHKKTTNSDLSIFYIDEARHFVILVPRMLSVR